MLVDCPLRSLRTIRYPNHYRQFPEDYYGRPPGIAAGEATMRQLDSVITGLVQVFSALVHLLLHISL